MTRQQKRNVIVTKQLLRNEIWMYGRATTTFSNMRKFVKKEKLWV